MASVEIAIRSIFQDDGVKGAEKGLQKLIEKLDVMQLEAAESSESVQHLMTRFMALSDAPPQFKGFKAIEVEIRELEERFKELKKAALAAFAKGRGDAGREFDQEAQQVERLIQANLKLKTSFNNVGVASRILTQLDFTSMTQGTLNSKQLTQSVAAMTNRMKVAAQSAVKLGDVAQLRTVSKSVKNLKAFIKELEEVGGASDSTKQRLAGLRNELTSLSSSHRESKNTAGLFLKSLNRIGFSLFLIKSSVRTVIGVFEGLINVFKDGAEQASLFQAFDKAILSTGANLQLLKGTLAATSRGLLDQNKMMQATLRLMKAGVPDFEKTAATMAGLAVNAAKVSGELGNVDEIFEKLVKGIVRGSPRLIDDTDVVLKLGDAYERYAEMIGKSTDELTEKDQQRAVVSALEEESIRMEELSEAVGDLPSEPFKILENQLKLVTRAASSAVGIIGGELAGSLVDILGLGGKAFDTVADAVAHAEKEAEKFNTKLEEIRGVIAGFEKDDPWQDALSPAETNKELQTFADTLGVSEQIQIRLLQNWHTMSTVVSLVWNAVAIAIQIAAAPLARMWEWLGQMAIQLKEDIIPSFGIIGAALSGDFELVKELFLDLGRAVVDGVAVANADLREDMAITTADIQDNIDKILTGFEKLSEFGRTTNLIGIMQALIPELEGVGGAAVEAAHDMSAVEQAILELERILGDEAKFLRQSAEVWADWGDKVREINENWTEKVAEIHEERLERIKENWEDFSDKILEINEDLAEDLANLEESFNDKREKEQKKHQKKKENNEESFQKKIDAIMRRFELSRLRAIIDRDARALFEAEFRRDEDLKAAEEAAKDKKEDEDKRHEEELKELEEAERKKREKLKAEAEKARKEAEERRIEEAAAIKKWEAEQLKKAAESAIDQRNAAKEAADDRILDLRKALDEKQFVEDANLALEKLRQLTSTDDATQYAKDIVEIWEMLMGFAAENPLVFTTTFPDIPNVPGGGGSSGSGGDGGDDDGGDGGGGGGGDTGSDPDDPFDGNPPHNGKFCDVGRWKACKKWVAADGSSWLCTPYFKGSQNGNWRPGTSNNVSTCNFIVNGGGDNNIDQQDGVQAQSTFAGNAGNGNAGGGRAAGTTVVIEARGDNTLERIFRELAYDVFLEITE